MKENIKNISESYGRIGENEDRFDIEFWKRQGSQASFSAGVDTILDYLMLRHGHVDKPRLQRNVESFGKADLIKAKEASGRELRKAGQSLDPQARGR